MHRQTLRLRETLLGKEHPDTLASMDNLAGVLSDQGKYEQAESMYRQATQAERDGAGQRACLHTNDHERASRSAERSGQVSTEY